jgi:hypothetical protein
MRRDAAPHSGQVATLASARAVTTIVSAARLTLSTASPLGTREEIRNLVGMALIPSGKQHQSGSQLNRD